MKPPPERPGSNDNEPARAEANPRSGAGEDYPDHRVALREAVLKAAQIVFDGTAIDCLVIDVSRAGARLRTAAVVAIPEQVTLRFSGGVIFAAHRRWTRGMDIGVALDPIASLAEEPAELAWRLYDIVRATTLEPGLARLRDPLIVQDPDLQHAAEQAEAGLRRLEILLASRARGRPRLR